MVYIIILNWNGWQDTIECLESVFRLNYSNYKVIVCDNASEDGSLAKLKAWAEGDFIQQADRNNQLAYLSTPPVNKPIAYIEYNRNQAELGGDLTDNARLIFIQTGANLGFSGGNNIGLKYALARNEAKYIWLLNNDTIINRNALTEMINLAEKDPKIGVVGSKLLYTHQPDTIQTLGGGRLNCWQGTVEQIGNGKKDRCINYAF